MEYPSSEKLILVVDDELDVAISIQLILETAHYNAEIYTDPAKALMEFKPNRYDLIFLDVRMPVMNGFQLYQELRKTDDNCKVCFITAFETYYNSLKEFFPDLDVDCFIQKPVTKDKLLEIVSRELNL